MNGIRMHRVLLPRGHSTATIPVTFVTAETWREQRERLDGRARAFADAAGFEPKPGRHLLLPAAEGARPGARVARQDPRGPPHDTRRGQSPFKPQPISLV